METQIACEKQNGIKYCLTLNLSTFDVMYIQICSPNTKPRRRQFAGYLPHSVSDPIINRWMIVGRYLWIRYVP